MSFECKSLPKKKKRKEKDQFNVKSKFHIIHCSIIGENNIIGSLNN